MRNVVISKAGKKSVTDTEAFKFYRENAKHRDKDFTYNIFIHRKFLNSFYQKISEKLISNNGGVFIKGFGYFSIIMHPKKQFVMVPYNKTGFANFKTDNYLFTPSFFGITEGNPLLNFWVMDRTFSKVYVKQKLHKALMLGKKYKTYISTISSLYLFKKNNK